MEHISTLCAAGTVGIAATGFALARQDQQQQQLPTPPVTPSKLGRLSRTLRKKPGKSRSRIFSPSTHSFIARSPLGRFLDMSPSPPQPEHHTFHDASHDITAPGRQGPSTPSTPKRRDKLRSSSRFFFKRSPSQIRHEANDDDDVVHVVNHARQTNQEVASAAEAPIKYRSTAEPAAHTTGFAELALSDVKYVNDRGQAHRINHRESSHSHTISPRGRDLQKHQQPADGNPSPRRSRQRSPRLPWMRRLSLHFNPSSSAPSPMIPLNDENDGRVGSRFDASPNYLLSHDPLTDANPSLFHPPSPQRQLKKAKRFQRHQLRTEQSQPALNNTTHDVVTSRIDQRPEYTSKPFASAFWRKQTSRQSRPKSLTFRKDVPEQVSLPSPVSPEEITTSLPPRPYSAGDFGMITQPHEREVSSMEDAWQPYFSPVSEHMWPPSPCRRSVQRSRSPKTTQLPLLSPDPNAPPMLVLASDMMMSPAASDRWPPAPYNQPFLSPVQSVGDDASSIGDNSRPEVQDPAQLEENQYPGSWKLSKARVLRRPASSIVQDSNDNNFDNPFEHSNSGDMTRPPMISHSLPLRRKRSFTNPSTEEPSESNSFSQESFAQSDQNISSTFPRAARLRRHPAQPNLRPDSGVTWVASPSSAGLDSGVAMPQKRISINSNLSSPTLIGTLSDRTCISEDESDQWTTYGFNKNSLRTFRLSRPSSRPRGPPLENLFIQPLASALEGDLSSAAPQYTSSSYELERQFRASKESSGLAQDDDLLEAITDASLLGDEITGVHRQSSFQDSRDHDISSLSQGPFYCGSTEEEPVSAKPLLASAVRFPVHHHRSASLGHEARQRDSDDSFFADWDEFDADASDIEGEFEPSRLRPSKSDSSTMPHGLTNKNLRVRPDSAILLQEHLSMETRSSVFDWSEQPHDVSTERDRENGQTIRPKTVHGKQLLLNEPRGSRESLRRNPSSVHLRSKSVPTARIPLVTGPGDQSMMKFATWGLGTKGVSEDWDGDFDFEDDDFECIDDDGDLNDAVDTIRSPGATMRVPKSIMETQASVHGQFGQVQELTFLVEELKRLIGRGNMLGLCEGPSSDLWKEAKAIIHLANFEEEDESIKKEEAAIAQTVAHVPEKPAVNHASVSPAVSFDSVEAAFASFNSSPVSWKKGMNPNIQVKSGVLPSLQSSSSLRQELPDEKLPKAEMSKSGKDKLPFDTQSLKALVSRSNIVTRSLKDILRKAERVPVDPKTPNLSHKASFSSGSPKSFDDKRVLRRLSQMFVKPLHESESALSVLTSSSAHQRASPSSMLVTELF